MVEKQVYDSYRGAVTAVGQMQERITKDISQRHKQDKETLDAQWKVKTAALNKQLASSKLQLVQARRDLSLVSAAASSAASDLRICYADRNKLGREISDALADAAEQDLADATRGEQAIIAASQCREWAGKIGTLPGPIGQNQDVSTHVSFQ